MTIESLLEQLQSAPDNISFQDVMATIDSHYSFTETAFRNGKTDNDAGKNNGSCKLFAFALLQNLTAEQTLALFGAYYRQDVLTNPEGSDHANIRNFMISGWQGIEFAGEALAAK